MQRFTDYVFVVQFDQDGYGFDTIFGVYFDRDIAEGHIEAFCKDRGPRYIRNDFIITRKEVN